MNHALHIAAVTQIRWAHSPGRKFYDRKRDEGHGGKSAIRALKRRISDVVYRHLIADARRASNSHEQVREGNQGRLSNSSVAG
jgi:transposase